MFETCLLQVKIVMTSTAYWPCGIT